MSTVEQGKLKGYALLCAFILMAPFYGLAQENDSLRIYKKLKHAAAKHRITRLAYEAVFVDPEPKEYTPEPAPTEEVKQINPFLLYPGKIIRNISITVLDPFGNSVWDTMPRNTNILQKAGNRFHLKTRHWIIRNRLLFKENDSINPLALSETERILREQAYVNDARVFISPTTSRDSIDVNVIVHDKWPITVPILITDVSGNVRFKNNNLFGMGQQFEHYVGFRRPDVLDYSGYYNISNIDETYISSRLGYYSNKDATALSLSFDRGFFSPLAKWAGGLALNHTWRTFSVTDTVSDITRKMPLNLFNYDVWLGKSFKLNKSKSMFNQSTNIIMGTRYFNNSFVNRPSFAIDTNRSNLNWGGLINNIGFAVQQYYKDQYIYRFGANEDVPEGLIVQFIYGGYKKETDKLRFYNGIEVARAKHYQFGYLSATFSYGIFYNTKVANDVTTNYNLYYFSNLVKNGKWLFRQFVNFNLVHGENKLQAETITLRPEDMYGFNNGSLTGNTKMVLNSETVAYMPYNVVGFRFAPVFLVGLGVIGDRDNPLAKSILFQAYSLGIMFRNENLLSSTFHFSVGFYPLLPDGSKNKFLYNPIGSFTLKVRSFSVGRPEFVAY